MIIRADKIMLPCGFTCKMAVKQCRCVLLFIFFDFVKGGCRFQYLYRVHVALALESWYKGRNTPVRSPVWDEESMRPGQWLGLVLCIPFRVLTLSTGWREGHPARKKLSCSRTVWVLGYK